MKRCDECGRSIRKDTKWGLCAFCGYSKRHEQLEEISKKIDVEEVKKKQCKNCISIPKYFHKEIPSCLSIKGGKRCSSYITSSRKVKQ